MSSLKLVFCGLAVATALACHSGFVDPGSTATPAQGNTPTPGVQNKETPTPSPEKSCEGVVRIAENGGECQGCKTEYPADKKISKPCTGPNGDQCPLKTQPYVTACPDNDMPVEDPTKPPRNTCKLFLKDVTTCQ